MMLDTSFILNLWQGEPAAVAKAREIEDGGVAIYLPAPVLFELWDGVSRSGRPREEEEKIISFLRAHDVLPFGDRDARDAGLLAGRLSKEGKTMGTVDVQLAGMAKARKLRLLTSDRRFDGMPREVPVEIVR